MTEVLFCCTDRGEHPATALGAVLVNEVGKVQTYPSMRYRHGGRRDLSRAGDALDWYRQLPTAESERRASECVRGRDGGTVQVWCPRCTRAPRFSPSRLGRIGDEPGVATGPGWAVVDIARVS